MATYKVLQDIEAEDKLIGPLTLRQFIYALVAALFGYLTFLVISKGAAFMAIIFIPLAAASLFFAWPWSRDQPTEVWALAKIRFLVKPRKRIWNQSGIKELVTVTAPQKVEQVLTNGLSENEVRSRLRALSDTIDSRGWAIKNINVNMYDQPTTFGAMPSDRLVSTAALPQPVIEDQDVRASDDMLDVQNNPVAQQFNSMIEASARAHRQEIINRMQEATAPAPPPPTIATPMPNPIGAPAQPQQVQPQQPANNYWFLNQPAQTSATVPQDSVTFNTQVVAPGTPVNDLPVSAADPTAAEESFIKQLKNEPAFSPNMHGHLHVIQPLSAQNTANPTGVPQPPAMATAAAPQTAAPQVTQAPDTAILDLARNDDLNVATIAREAQKRKEPPQDEVVISLH